MAMSAENKRKASERMKARHAAKSQESQEVTTPEPKEDTINQEVNVTALMAQIKEMQETQTLLKAALLNQASQGPEVSQKGRLIGTFEKYIVDPGAYPNPVERLTAEERLAQHAFPINYELGFSVSETAYETIDGIRQKEPKFTLELNKIVRDEETGEQTNGRYTICRLIFHEDPEAAVIVAREHGLEVDETNQKSFLNEMRYLRMRDWLFECFYPPRQAPQQVKRDMIINNRQVEYFEISSEGSQSIPFSQLKSKVK